MSEVPSFIYGRGDDFKQRLLIMRSIDVPAASSLTEDMCDVALENIEVVGRRVRALFACAISHWKNGLRCASRSISDR